MGTLKEALFSIIGERILGARFLDLFAGSGAGGLEALSRGAKEVVFVEQDRSSGEVIKQNLSLLKEEGQVIVSDVTRYLHAYEGEPFDIIFADPPYGYEWEVGDAAPLLRPGALCFMEERKGFNIPDLKTLEFVVERRYGSSLLYEWRKR